MSQRQSGGHRVRGRPAGIESAAGRWRDLPRTARLGERQPGNQSTSRRAWESHRRRRISPTIGGHEGSRPVDSRSRRTPTPTCSGLRREDEWRLPCHGTDKQEQIKTFQKTNKTKRGEDIRRGQEANQIWTQEAGTHDCSPHKSIISCLCYKFSVTCLRRLSLPVSRGVCSQFVSYLVQLVSLLYIYSIYIYVALVFFVPFGFWLIVCSSFSMKCLHIDPCLCLVSPAFPHSYSF